MKEERKEGMTDACCHYTCVTAPVGGCFWFILHFLWFTFNAGLSIKMFFKDLNEAYFLRDSWQACSFIYQQFKNCRESFSHTECD